jgi:transcriptional regulator with XRE-family HTH domain
MTMIISGEECRQLRLEKGFSQTDVSNAAGLGGQGIISNFERGLAVSPETNRRIAEALGMVNSTVTRGTAQVNLDV